MLKLFPLAIFLTLADITILQLLGAKVKKSWILSLQFHKEPISPFCLQLSKSQLPSVYSLPHLLTGLGQEYISPELI